MSGGRGSLRAVLGMRSTEAPDGVDPPAKRKETTMIDPECVVCCEPGEEQIFTTGVDGYGDEVPVILCDRSECLTELEARGLDS